MFFGLPPIYSTAILLNTPIPSPSFNYVHPNPGSRFVHFASCGQSTYSSFCCWVHLTHNVILSYEKTMTKFLDSLDTDKIAFFFGYTE